MKGFPLFPHSFPPLKGKTLWKAGPIEAPSIPKIAVFHRHTADAQRLSRTSGQDAPTAGTQCLSRLRRGPRQQTATIVSSAPRGKALQKQMGSLIAHPQGALHKGQAHRVFRAYGEGRSSKPQRWHPPLHRGKPYRSRWEVLLPTHREYSAKAGGKVCKMGNPFPAA